MASKSSKKQSIASATKKSNSAIYGPKSKSSVEQPLKADLNANSSTNENEAAIPEKITKDRNSASHERTWREVCACPSPQNIQNTEEFEVERCVPDYSGIVQRLAHARMLRLIQWNQANTRCRQLQAMTNATKTLKRAKKARCARKCACAETDNAVMNECKTNTEVPYGWDATAGQFCIHICTKLPGCNCAGCRAPAPEFVTPSPPHDFNVPDQNTGTGLGFNVQSFPEAPVNLRVVSQPRAPSLEKVPPAPSSDDFKDDDGNEYEAYLVPVVPPVVAYPVLRTSNPLDSDVFCETPDIEEHRRSSVNPPMRAPMTPQPFQNFPPDKTTNPESFPRGPLATSPPLLNLARASPPITNQPRTFSPITNPPRTFTPATNRANESQQITNQPRSFPPITNPPNESPPFSNQPRSFPPNTNPPRASPPITNPPHPFPPITNPPRTFPPISYPPRTSMTIQHFPPNNMTTKPNPLAIPAAPPPPISKPPRAIFPFPPQHQNPPLNKWPLGPLPPLLPPAADHPTPKPKVGIPNIPARPPDAHTFLRKPPTLAPQTKEYSKLQQPDNKNSIGYRTLGTENPSCDPLMIARLLRMQAGSTSAAINMLFQAESFGRRDNNAAALMMQRARVQQHERRQGGMNALQQLFDLARRNFGAI